MLLEHNSNENDKRVTGDESTHHHGTTTNYLLGLLCVEKNKLLLCSPVYWVLPLGMIHTRHIDEEMTVCVTASWLSIIICLTGTCGSIKGLVTFILGKHLLGCREAFASVFLVFFLFCMFVCFSDINFSCLCFWGGTLTHLSEWRIEPRDGPAPSSGSTEWSKSVSKEAFGSKQQRWAVWPPAVGEGWKHEGEETVNFSGSWWQENVSPRLVGRWRSWGGGKRIPHEHPGFHEASVSCRQSAASFEAPARFVCVRRLTRYRTMIAPCQLQLLGGSQVKIFLINTF